MTPTAHPTHSPGRDDPERDPLAREALAPHVQRLRSLARSLIGCGHEADDAVGDTMLRAVQHPPTAGGKLGAWLSAVLLNRVRSRRLEAQRRRQRERSAAHAEAVSDSIERFELCKRVVAVVDELGPTDRAVVTMRYFDDLPPRVIAKRLGLPVNTVRTRLRRALQKLRVQLDAAHGGDRSVWSASLLPFAYPGGMPTPVAPAAPPSPPPAAGWTAVAQGVTVMHSKTKIAALAIVLGGLTVALSWPFLDSFGSSDAPPGQGAKVSTQRPDAPAHEEVSASADDRAVADSISARSAISTEWQVRGIAVRRDGSLAVGVALTANLFDGGQSKGNPLHTAVVRTDEAGTFAWAPPPPERTCALSFRCEDPRWLCPDRVWVLPQGRAPADEIVLRLVEVDAAIEGTVTGEDGTPIADAVVRVGDALTITLLEGVAATSGPDGAYRVQTPSRGGLTSLVVTAKGHAHFFARLPAPRAGQTVRRDVVLQRGYRVWGTVTDTDGAPIEGARVSTQHSHLSSAVTDAQGRYEITSLDRSEQSDVVFTRHAEYYGYGRRVELDQAEQRLDLTMRPALQITGTVRNESGAAIEGALVFIRDDSLEEGRPDAITTRDGGFALTSVPWLENLVVRATGYGIAVVDVGLGPPDDGDGGSRAGGKTIDPIEVVLRGGRQVAGVVTDTQGRPLPVVTILGDLAKSTASGRHVGTLAHTGTDGRFVITGLPATPVSLTFAKAGYRRGERHNLLADGLELQVQLERVAGVAGTVVDGESGAPIPAFTIRFVRTPLDPGQKRAGGYARAWAYGLDFFDERGAWSTALEEFAAGYHVGVVAHAEGYAASEPVTLVTRLDPDPAHTIVRLWRGSTLRGLVTDDRTGRPVGGALVFLFGPADAVRGLYESRGPPGLIPRVRTDDAGAFAFENVGGKVTLAVRHPDYAPRIDGPFDVVGNSGSTERSQTLHQGATVRGRVVASTGAPRAGVTVYLAPNGAIGGRVMRAHADRDGHFTFARLQPGRHTVRLRRYARGTEWYPLRRSVILGPTADVEVDLNEHEGTARLYGEARLAQAEPAFVELRGTDPGSLVRTCRTSTRTFEFSGLRPGTYQIAVVTSAGRQSQRVEVTAGENELVIE